MYVIHPYYLLHVAELKSMNLIDLKNVICEVMEIKDLNSKNLKSRAQKYVIAKLIFCMIATNIMEDNYRKYTVFQIGEVINRDHSTVSYSKIRGEKYLKQRNIYHNDMSFKEIFEKVNEKIKTQWN